jgi:hypothetical protein
MDDATDLARALCQGSLEQSKQLALTDAGVRAEVERRLVLVGHQLVETGGGWVALPREPIDHSGLAPHRPLDDRARVVRSLLYLRLVFVPVEHGRDPSAARGISLDVVVDELESRGWGKGDADAAIGAVVAAGWVHRTRDRRLRAAPALVAADAHVHERLADRIIREQIERIAEG